MKRNGRLAVLILAAASPVLLRAGVEAARPNVILICIDTLRADHISAYGYYKKTTPRIDAFAGDGIIFERFYAAAPWTTPSHMSMFTSLYPSDHELTRIPKDFRFGAAYAAFRKTFAEKGFRGLFERYIVNRLAYRRKAKKGAVPLAQVFKKEGYATGAFVASKFLSPAFGFSRGFDKYSWEHFAPGEDRARAALEFLDKGTGPKFVFLHLYDAHGDLGLVTLEDNPVFKGPVFHVPEPYKGIFSAKLPRGEFDGTFETLVPLLRKGRFTGKDIKYLSALYDDGILHADKVAGDFLEELKKRGLYDNSVIAVVSDHGESLGEKGEVGHNCAFGNGVLHVPFILKPSGERKTGRRNAATAGGVDVLPTLLAAAGLNPSPGLAAQMKGRDLLASGRGSPVYSETNCYEYARVYRGIMDEEGWKMACNLSTGEKNLYHLISDPAENREMSAREGVKAAALEEAITLKYALGE